MRYLSLFSGIEAATVAWEFYGWECVAVSEIEPFPCALLKHHYPNVPNLGDVTKITEADITALGRIDLVVFGSPCQDLSVAGKRKGFNGERSGLFHTAIQIIKWAKKNNGCRFALWENVAGAFSSNQKRDFAAVVEELAGCRDVDPPALGWGTEGVALGDDGLLEWCVLDAQWFGVAQRRRRVFAVVDFGDWVSRGPILLECESLRGNIAPCRNSGETTTHNVAPSLKASGPGVNRVGDTRGQDPVVAVKLDVDVCGTLTAGFGKMGAPEVDAYTCIPTWPAEIASTLNAAFGSKQGLEDQHVNSGHPLFVPVINVHGTQNPCVSDNTAFTLGCNSGQENVVTYGIPGNWIGRKPENGGNAIEPMRDIAPCLTGTDRHGISTDMAVRRLTPKECERLQGFPDDYTLIPLNKKERISLDEFKSRKVKMATDGPRYKALGNSMAVPCMAWVGARIGAAHSGFM